MEVAQKFNLSGKVAVITGASKGIGEAIGLALGKAGAKVVVSSRKQEAVEEVAQVFRQAGIDAQAIACNTGQMEDNERLVKQVVELYGGIDILVNNAATNPIYGPIFEADVKALDKIMDVNLKGPFYLAKLCYPIMKQRGGGAVINIASIEGIKPSENLGIYSISKAALIMMTKVMANEMGKANIRVNAICPGYIKTKLSEMVWNNQEMLDGVLSQQSIRHEGQPDDIAGIALLLASGAGAFFTGSVVTVDGGMTV
ncbi:MAG TPA: short-chain dehydrogenase [Microscillaceae bacterium]|nr:short-chain dehydrogenase [Microscillaceae bacterium]